MRTDLSEQGEAVISVGRNSYGHPTVEAINLLEKFNVKIRRTDTEGEIKYNYRQK